MIVVNPAVRQWEIIYHKKLNAEIIPQNNIVLEHRSAELIPAEVFPLNVVECSDYF